MWRRLWAEPEPFHELPSLRTSDASRPIWPARLSPVVTSLSPPDRSADGARKLSDELWRKTTGSLANGRAAILLLLCFGLAMTATLETVLSGDGKRGPVSAAPHMNQVRTDPAAGATPADMPELPPGAVATPDAGPAADIARSINASIAFVPDGRVPAAPVFWAGGTVDRERATDCLAAAGIYEAGSGAADQRAVMQVILNRMRHSAFPHSVCGVVFQGAERTTGCQFTFTCDGAMLRHSPSPEAWRRARIIAMEMLTGRVEPAVGLATHYHTDWVHPAWSGRLQKIAAVSTHLFLRWRGNFGEPRAFTARYSGSEPLIAKMALLSAAHRDLNLPGDAAMLPAAQFGPSAIAVPKRMENTLTAAREVLPDQARAPDADVFLMTLDGSSPDNFIRQAQQACAGKATCRFLGWTSPAHKASQFPISGTAIDAMSFSYIKQGSGDAGKARWNCAEFPRGDRTQCLRRGG